MVQDITALCNDLNQTCIDLDSHTSSKVEGMRIMMLTLRIAINVFRLIVEFGSEDI